MEVPEEMVATAQPAEMEGQVLRVPGVIGISVMESRSSEATGVSAAEAVETEASASAEDPAVVAATVLRDWGDSVVPRIYWDIPQRAVQEAGAAWEPVVLWEVTVERVAPVVPAHPVEPEAALC